jgi:hypothetical protein
MEDELLIGNSAVAIVVRGPLELFGAVAPLRN